MLAKNNERMLFCPTCGNSVRGHYTIRADGEYMFLNEGHVTFSRLRHQESKLDEKDLHDIYCPNCLWSLRHTLVQEGIMDLAERLPVSEVPSILILEEI